MAAFQSVLGDASHVWGTTVRRSPLVLPDDGSGIRYIPREKVAAYQQYLEHVTRKPSEPFLINGFAVESEEYFITRDWKTPGGKFVCEICNEYDTNDIKAFNKHMKTCAENVNKKKLIEEKELKAQEPRFICKYCGLGHSKNGTPFITEHGLLIHERMCAENPDNIRSKIKPQPKEGEINDIPGTTE
ncbi:MAG: hypothetical protein WC505_07230 [Patescibacteria group bacterium]